MKRDGRPWKGGSKLLKGPCHQEITRKAGEGEGDGNRKTHSGQTGEKGRVRERQRKQRRKMGSWCGAGVMGKTE